MVARIALAPAPAVLVLTLLVLAGCSSAPAGPSSGAAESSGDVAPSVSASASGSRQAWVRGTSVTLTNATASTVDVKTWTASGGKGSYAAVAPGASTAATSEWSSASGTGVVFYVKRPSGGVAALMVHNPSVDTPWTKTCESSSLTGCDSDVLFVEKTDYDEGETKTTSTKDGGVTFTVTRNSDDDDNKNWTVSLDSLS